VAFKAAMVAACRFFPPPSPSMVMARTLFHVHGEGPDQLVGLDTGDGILREDTPRNADGIATLRYRYAFFPWRALLKISFMPAVISHESVVALLDASGRVGVGEWRPGSPKSFTGTFGTYRIMIVEDATGDTEGHE
jgi:hypothetical protein